ncbi:MAG TPA: DUF4433 domain-containing protein [Dehalococcoidia bacterium]|nr:DUF4433 domain-containing protein [Dehalococcoidia bacterium]
MRIPEITGLYYITHIENIPSILQRGILAHEKIIEEGVEYTPIYDEQIVNNRREKQTPDGHSLWHFANLYFQPRNPMLYRVVHEKDVRQIAIVSVQPNVLDRLDIFITTGNAAHSQTEIMPAGVGRKELRRITKDTLMVDFWYEEDGSKRRIMAECLVPELILPEKIQNIYVVSHEIKANLESMIHGKSVPIVPDPKMFFRPTWASGLTPKLFLAQDDMFFARLHTLTISVNTVGVMGRGLASRAKYFSPDLYVHYQDLCRSRKLRMGRPVLYKRETSLDYQLADDPKTLSNGNSETWFLLFPTKRHWRERSDIKGIEEGLQWIIENYKNEGIKSLALPALGCGLGRLDWKDVGPIMCRYLKTLDIQVVIYLPAEREIKKELLTQDFLLS